MDCAARATPEPQAFTGPGLLLKTIQSIARLPLRILRRLLDLGFVPISLNPLRHLGSLTIYFCWIVLVSGIWLFIFFRTSVDGAYQSVEYLTHNQWYLGGVMRSLHRYASDAAIITLVLHISREFAFDRYRGKRWFSWVTGMPLLWLILPLGITGHPTEPGSPPRGGWRVVRRSAPRSRTALSLSNETTFPRHIIDPWGLTVSLGSLLVISAVLRVRAC